MNAIAAEVLLTPLPRLYLAAGVLSLLAGALGYAARKHRSRAPTAALLALGALGLGLAACLPLNTGGKPGKLPAITLEDIAGNAVALAELPDRDRRRNASAPVILHLWAADCPACRRIMPAFAALRRREGVSIVGINQGDDLLPTVRYMDTLAERSSPFTTVLRDPRQRLMAAFGTRRLPLTLLLDARGRVQQRHVGPLGRATLAGWLDDQRLRKPDGAP